MTKKTTDHWTPTRRSVLRLGTMSALGVGIGIPAFAGSAAATKCPRTPGFWANHPDAWEPLELADPLTIRGVTMTHSEWRDFLVSPTKGDKAKIMAKHYLASVLNLRNRPVDDPTCTDVELKEGPFEGHTIEDVKNKAGDWLSDSNWAEERKQKRWMAGGVDGEALKDMLDTFNNDPSSLGLSCSCDNEPSRR